MEGPNHNHSREQQVTQKLRESIELLQREYSREVQLRIQGICIESRQLMTQHFVHRYYTKYPSSILQYKYLLLGVGLNVREQGQLSQRWNIFYYIINEVLKKSGRERSKMEKYLLIYSLFLFENNMKYFDEFERSYELIRKYQIVAGKEKLELKANHSTRIFNSLLCLQTISLNETLYLLNIMKSKVSLFSNYLPQISNKLVRKLPKFTAEFTIQHIQILLSLFYDISKTQFSKESLITLIDIMKNGRFINIMQLVVRIVLQNRDMKGRKFIIELCLSCIGQASDDLFAYLLRVSGEETQLQIVVYLQEYIGSEGLRYINVSRVKQLLKRLIGMHRVEKDRIFGYADLIQKVAIKHNEESPKLYLKRQSNYSIKNIKNGLSLIFVVDLHEKLASNKIVQVQTNKEDVYEIVLHKVGEGMLLCIYEGSNELIRENVVLDQEVNNLFMLNVQHKTVQILVNTRLFQIKTKAMSVSGLKFGSFVGILKDINIFQTNMNISNVQQYYNKNYSKVKQIIKLFQSKEVIFSQTNSLQTNAKKSWFWQKTMEVQEKNVVKFRDVSFGEAIQQLGGLPNIFYLYERTIPYSHDPSVIPILERLVCLLKVIVVQGELKYRRKWMKVFPLYFSEFLWLIINRNEHVGKSASLFNKVFDFLGWFASEEKEMERQQFIEISYNIIQNIYMNFELWNKCSSSIAMISLSVLERYMKNVSILQKMIVSNSYENLMTSLIIYYKDYSVQQYRGLNNRILELCVKLCRYEQEYRRCMKINMFSCYSLLSSFFYKKRLLFSQHEQITLNHIIQHFTYIYIRQALVDTFIDNMVYLVYNNSKLIYSSPSQLQIIYKLTMLSLHVIEEAGNLNNTLIFIINSITIRNDSLSFKFRLALKLISNKTTSQGKSELVESMLIMILNGLQDRQFEVDPQQVIAELQSMNGNGYGYISSDKLVKEIILKCRVSTQVQIMCCIVKTILERNIVLQTPSLLNYCMHNIGIYYQHKELTNIKTITDLGHQLKRCNLTNLLHCCRSQACLNLLIMFSTIWIIPTFTLPINTKNFTQSEKGYGGQLAFIISSYTLTYHEYTTLYTLFIQALYSLYSQEYSILNDVVLYYLPVFFIKKSLQLLMEMSKKPPQRQKYEKVVQILHKSTKVSKLNDFYALYIRCKSLKGKFQEYERVRNIEQFEILGNRVVECYEKGKQQITLNNLQVVERMQQIENKLQYINKNMKSFKKLNQQLNDMHSFMQVLIKAFMKTNIQNVQQSLLSKIKLGKKNSKKQVVISDKQFYEPFCEELKRKLGRISHRYKKKSDYREEKWRELVHNNIHWTSTKMKDNECYEIDQKITGYYRLNVVKKEFDEIPYPRRKSIGLQNSEEEDDNTTNVESFMNSLLNEAIFIPEEEPEIQIKVQDKEIITKNSQYFYCEYVTQKGTYAGKLYLLQNYQNYKQENVVNYSILFKCIGYYNLPQERIYHLSTKFHRVNDLEFKLKININRETQVFSRRYILRHTAVQVFSNHYSYFFNLFKGETQDRFFQFLKDRVVCIKDLRAQFNRRNYTKKWLSGGLDNFQYLMLVNKYSGRNFHDLGQYPVFPWVIKNYQATEVEFDSQFMKNTDNLRDLSVPAGKIDSGKFEKIKMRCNQIPKEERQIRFMYGTMISNPTVIYSFFIRLQPFTSLHWDHQGRRIDHADRLFSSVYDQFRTVITSSSDNKQLAPQFYYWPQFLKNRNQIDLGIKQNKEVVHDVKLPGWAQSPQEFIFKMREVLECPQVTKYLHNWIDLIFGYKNPEEVAQKYDNLYHYRTYEHDIFETEEKDSQIQSAQITISEFGQVPYPLFTSPHPQKKPKSQIDLDKSKIIKKEQKQKRLRQFSLDKNGIFIASQNDIQFLTQTLTSNKVYNEGGGYSKLINFNEHIWLCLKEGILSLYKRKQCLCMAKIDSKVFETMYGYVLYGYKSQIKLLKIQQNQIFQIKSFYGHKNTIKLITICKSLDIFVSVDEDGLTLVHQFYTGKLLRQFELGTRRVTKLCIHEMGYFMFFTSDEQLIVYTYLGELFLHQDIKILHKQSVQQITTIQVFSQNRSLLLLGTSVGNIYIVDFLRIKRYCQSFPFKTYSRIKNNLLKNCQKVSSPIRQIQIVLLPAECATYRIYVMYDNGCFQYYYESKMIGKQLKSNQLLNSLGLFRSQKNN